MAVPVKNASSAVNSMNGVRLVTVSFIPSFAASSATTSAVMPARAPVEVGGVKISPFLTMKMFSPTPSAMQPLLSRQMASSTPHAFASIFARTLFR